MNPQEQQPVSPQTVTPAPQTSAPMPMAPSGKKMNKNVLIAIIMAAVLLVAGVAWGVYAMVMNSPENLMKAAVQNLSKEKQLAATIKVVNGTENANTTFTGDVAVSIDPSNQKNGEVIAGLGSSDQRVGLSVLTLDKTLYMKLSGAENLGTLLGSMSETSSDTAALASPQFAAMLKNLNDQWFELNEEDLKSLSGSATSTETEVATASPEDLKKVFELYDRHPFVKADQTYADEVVDGANSAHFSIKIDKNEYVAFAQSVKDANLATIKLTDEDMQKVKDSDPMKDTIVEFWIARDSKEFKQVRMVHTKKGEEASITLTMTGKLPTFDKFEKPAGTKSITELMTTLLGSSIDQAELESMRYSQSSEMYQTQ